MNWSTIATILPMILSVIAVILAIGKFPLDALIADSTTAKAYADAADRAEARAKKYEERAAEHLKKIACYELKIVKYEIKIDELTQDKEDVMKWADQLVRQVVKLGGTPMPFKKGE